MKVSQITLLVNEQSLRLPPEQRHCDLRIKSIVPRQQAVPLKLLEVAGGGGGGGWGRAGVGRGSVAIHIWGILGAGDATVVLHGVTTGTETREEITQEY